MGQEQEKIIYPSLYVLHEFYLFQPKQTLLSHVFLIDTIKLFLLSSGFILSMCRIKYCTSHVAGLLQRSVRRLF